eukprot:scaffold17054_cov148-Isochrysis_galbana.AAC.2
MECTSLSLSLYLSPGKNSHEKYERQHRPPPILESSALEALHELELTQTSLSRDGVLSQPVWDNRHFLLRKYEADLAVEAMHARVRLVPHIRAVAGLPSAVFRQAPMNHELCTEGRLLRAPTPTIALTWRHGRLAGHHRLRPFLRGRTDSRLSGES